MQDPSHPRRTLSPKKNIPQKKKPIAPESPTLRLKQQTKRQQISDTIYFIKYRLKNKEKLKDAIENKGSKVAICNITDIINQHKSLTNYNESPCSGHIRTNQG